ncbi:hypothetical protein [Paenibacillus rhizovicinus]|uniref:hypothetical protein n=1 Tax=Paenibacillus rhizovicinus TaxID=2704463 RepID=UPI001CDC14A2|nr:hypothetical protein [Paenibacillus rhizovicinus]
MGRIRAPQGQLSKGGLETGCLSGSAAVPHARYRSTIIQGRPGDGLSVRFGSRTARALSLHNYPARES